MNYTMYANVSRYVRVDILGLEMRRHCVLVRMGDGNDRSANAYFVKHSAKGETIYSKGNENKGEVTSANSNSYPTNGYEDGIWYVYKGEY